MAVVRCANCGVGNDAGATFCASCHHFLAWEEGERRPPEPAATPVAEPAAEQLAHPANESVEARPIRPMVPDSPDGQSSPIRDVLGTVDEGRRLALISGRTDLLDHLDQTRAHVADQLVSVAVVGEFKRGKSTLVNALLQTAVCPVDADIVTAVPTAVRFGEQTAASAHVEPSADDPHPAVQNVPLEALAGFVSEAGNPGNRRRLRMVEVVLPHRMLRSGLCLVDTPGVGGLDSAHGVITLSALSQAEGLLFVTDASQELTAPELEFLKEAVARCANAACVVTKTDLYLDWRRIVELDEQHLRVAGLEVPVIPVSSFLRLGAPKDPHLLVESGFPALVDFLLGTVVPAGTARTVETAEGEVEFIAAQLEDSLRAEHAVLERPERAEQVIQRLDEAQQKTRRLAAPTATWQQMLTDGIQDLVANVEFDLQERLRTVMRDVEAIIDEGDPNQTWPDIEVWLRRQVVAAAVANYDRMDSMASELAESVASTFDLAASEVTSARSASVSDSLANVRMATAASLENPGGRVASMLMAGRTATLVPMILVGALGHLLLPVIAPLALVLAAGIGQKVIRDERRRQTAYRRQQAKNAARRYVDEVAFMVSKDSRDALRATQRALRDDFQARAAALHRSSEAALRAVHTAMALAPDERDARADAVARETAAVVDLRSRRSESGGLAVANG